MGTENSSVILERVVSPLYVWLLVLIYGSYMAAALGLWYVNPDWVHLLTICMQIFVAVVLLYRFNPWAPLTKIHAVDAQLIVASAVMLLINAGLASVFAKIART
jgi:hypothetical protein